MTDWRYWITYHGRIEADTYEQAKLAALADHAEWEPVDVEVERVRVPEPVEGREGE